MSAKAGGIPRYRPFDGPALLRQRFRPFFIGAGIWALAAVVLWLAALKGHVAIPTAFDPLYRTRFSGSPALCVEEPQ